MNEYIEQLESLRTHCQSMCTGDDDDIWAEDVKALDKAISAMQEV